MVVDQERNSEDVHVFTATFSSKREAVRAAFSSCGKAKSWVEWVCQCEEEIEWVERKNGTAWVMSTERDEKGVVHKTRIHDPGEWVTRYPVLAEL